MSDNLADSTTRLEQLVAPIMKETDPVKCEELCSVTLSSAQHASRKQQSVERAAWPRQPLGKYSPRYGTNMGRLIPAIEDVENVLDEIDTVGLPRKRRSKEHCLVTRNSHYPPKYVLMRAYILRTGFKPRNFTGDFQSTIHLQKMGYTIKENCRCGNTCHTSNVPSSDSRSSLKDRRV